MQLTQSSINRQILFVAGFGDNSSMFDKLYQTDLEKHFSLHTIDLPGFGGGEALPSTTLETLADVVERKVFEEEIDILVGHSIASVIVSIVANRHPSLIDAVISLEGNLTDKDYFFTGIACDHDSPEMFFNAFQSELRKLADPKGVVERYSALLHDVNISALYSLGRDATETEEIKQSGERLNQIKNVYFLYNSENYDPESVEWLKQSKIKDIEFSGATHWASIDAPQLVSDTILEIFGIDSL